MDLGTYLRVPRFRLGIYLYLHPLMPLFLAEAVFLINLFLFDDFMKVILCNEQVV